MTPVQGSVTSFKTSDTNATDSVQAAISGAGEGLGFAQTLQELSETNPNAAALLLALQQAGLVPQQPVAPQTAGSPLPTLAGAAGKPLPPAVQQSLQLNSLQQLPAGEMPQLEASRVLELLGDKTGLERNPLLAQMAGAGLAVDGLQALETRGLTDFGSQLQGLGFQLQPSQTGMGIRSAVALPVQVPVGQPGWDSALGDRIQWMVSRNVQQAEIKLAPPELGPMEIKISVQNDQTQVQFMASHATTRDALEAAIPRLRELFGEINLNLANVDVSQQQAGDASAEQGGDAQSQVEDGQAASGEYAQQERMSASGAQTLTRGLLDTYA
jgi:flagellar hook-length control protein FliK